MTEVHHGLEGVVAFETEIAEPDKEGSALRYRGVDIEDIVGRVPFENVWGLLIDGAYTPGLAPAEPYNLPVHTGDVRVDDLPPADVEGPPPFQRDGCGRLRLSLCRDERRQDQGGGEGRGADGRWHGVFLHRRRRADRCQRAGAARPRATPPAPGTL